MAFGTTQSNSVPLQGDNESKALLARKSELTEAIRAIGMQLEEGEKKLSDYNDIDSKITEIALELGALEEERVIILNEIEQRRADSEHFRKLSGDADAEQKRLDSVLEQIRAKQEELFAIQGRISFLSTELSAKELTAKATLAELDVLRQKGEALVATLGSQAGTLRGDIATLASVKEGKLNELKAVDTRLEVLFGAESDKKVQLADLDAQIDTKERELGALELSLESKRAADVVWFSNEKAVLKEKEDELATREGALSQRGAMIESRAELLRSAKVRLEHHLGRTLDIIIE